jgi:biuret amidohydrolase
MTSSRSSGEPVIDKPGKGAFYQTDFDPMLRNRSIDTLFVCGVTTERASTPRCVRPTTAATAASCYRIAARYFREFHDMGLKMIKAQGDIFGSVASSRVLLIGMGLAAAA